MRRCWIEFGGLFWGGSNSKQPQGSPLDPACQLPTGNARGDVFAVSLSPISHLHPTRFDLANPFDVTALSIARLALPGWCVYLAKMGQWHVKDSGGHRMGNLSLALEEPIRLAEAAARPLETTPRNEAPVEAACPNGMA